ncbi:hypothetical protein ACQEVF_53665 [Nonomuraea polychroma]|uniref:hypothetical protein n=1 Tax=Nonomuraea polychroma TaxID=46176 RepID=UPI003D8C7CAD
MSIWKRCIVGLVVTLVAILPATPVFGAQRATTTGIVAGQSSGWHLCTAADVEYIVPKVTSTVVLAALEGVTSTTAPSAYINNNDYDVTFPYSLAKSTTQASDKTIAATMQLSGKIVDASITAGYVKHVAHTTTESAGINFLVKAKTTGWVQGYSKYSLVAATVTTRRTELLSVFGTNWCRSLEHRTFQMARIPIVAALCSWSFPQEKCDFKQLFYGGSRGGQPAWDGGGTPAPGPQPVTSVHGLADGTLLTTTDTGRVYKMVGGAPIWQATCADGICSGTARPTTQAVINAGPATPRNASTVIDQRGRIFLFVGGAPIWQDSCAAPVSCGSPVKVSNWSVDARDHMNEVPADGHLVQAKAGTVDLPVAMTLGGSLVPFNNPQEVIDVGQGADWANRVVAISAASYNHLGFIPRDGTLVQGSGGGTSTPVAAIVGGARINYASPQELIDAGFGTNWASKVRAVPTRHFNLMPTVPSDGTLVQGSKGSTPVAAIMGTARVSFASPQEVIDAGFGTNWASKVRAVPERAFNALPTQIMDGTRIKNAGSAAHAAIIGGAKMPFASMEELNGSGYGDQPAWTVPSRIWDALPVKIADGTRIKNAGSAAHAAIIGGAKMPFASMEELNAAGYGDDPWYVVPTRVWNALSNDFGDGIRIGKAGSPVQGALVGGAKVPFASMEELEGTGYADNPPEHPAATGLGRVADADRRWDTDRQGGRDLGGRNCGRRQSRVPHHGRAHRLRLQGQAATGNPRPCLGRPVGEDRRWDTDRQGGRDLGGRNCGRRQSRVPHHGRAHRLRLQGQAATGNPRPCLGRPVGEDRRWDTDRQGGRDLGGRNCGRRQSRVPHHGRAHRLRL